MVQALSDTDILNMDDDEFLKTNPDPSLVQATEEVVAEEPVEPVEPVETPVVDAETPVVVEETEEAKAQRLRDEATGRFKKADDKTTPAVEPGKEATAPVPVEGQTKVETPVVAPAVVNFEEGYKQIMAPFKANGREIVLKTPQEAIQLMQMGANYTRKMQELAPARKVLTMLTNNGLLDEGKLSYLIDLDKKNPEAIKKLIKDAGIDPMEIDTSVEPAYTQGNHAVSDEEVAFHTALEDMKSTPEQVETLNVIQTGWDQVSKQALWKQPGLMAVMHTARANGVYDRIANEIERRTMLGEIPTGTPFLQAYKVIGDELYAQPPVTQTPVQPVVTRVQTPKSVVKNGERAAAVSPNRSTPSKAAATAPDFLNMKDEDFLKQFEGRV